LTSAPPLVLAMLAVASSLSRARVAGHIERTSCVAPHRAADPPRCADRARSAEARPGAACGALEAVAIALDNP
jgi:hypothetical protein